MNSEERSLLETSCGVTLSVEQEEQLDRYLATLQEWNQRINLTAVREASDLLRFHFFEALWAARNFMTPRTHLADIGSGPGFPGLVAKIYLPQLRVTLIERVGKKANFLRQAAAEIGAEVAVFSGTAEDFKGWGSVDLASCRAVALTKRLLTPLRRHRVDLLHFHGENSTPPGPDWKKIDRKLYPLSRARWVTLYTGPRPKR